ncbi:MAG: hypothetical protein WC659_00810 [Patescibacteria group bacterium]
MKKLFFGIISGIGISLLFASPVLAVATCNITDNVADDPTYICNVRSRSSIIIRPRATSNATIITRQRIITGQNSIIAGEDIVGGSIITGSATSTVVNSFSMGNITIYFSTGGIFPE